MNYKTVILYTSLCLLSSSSLTTIYASAAASSSNALAAVSLTDEVTSARLRPQDMLLVPFLQDKTEAEVKDIKRRAIEAAIKRPDASAMPLLEEAILYGHLPSMVA
ncbi:MAG: hypothetical protein NT128_04045, partial [Proteobacteria bacterium]|nr:hypothetical protein [Pseudomonadota bacterium]